MLVSHLGIAPRVSNKPTLDSGLCVPETKHRAAACSGVLWKVCRLRVLAGLGLDGAAKKNADSMRAGISVFPHGWIPSSWNGAQYIVGCPRVVVD